MLLVLVRRGSRWRLARPDPPRPGAVRARVTLPPRTLDYVRGVLTRPIRERPPDSFIVEPADPLSPARLAGVCVPSRYLRFLSPSLVPCGPCVP